MKQAFLIAASVTLCVLAVAVGSFCVFQTLKCNKLEKQIGILQPQNEELQKRIKSMASSQQNIKKQQKPVATPNVLTDSETQTEENQKTAYLTFDDGPSNITPHLLDILNEYDVKATFFVVAMDGDTPQRREWLKMEVSDGHSIGVHSFTHKYSYIYSSEENFLADFNKMKDLIVSATGYEPKFSRFPGGTDNTVSLTADHEIPIMPKLLEDCRKHGYYSG